jgi:hypothetical protein
LKNINFQNILVLHAERKISTEKEHDEQEEYQQHNSELQWDTCLKLGCISLSETWWTLIDQVTVGVISAAEDMLLD